MMVDRHNINTSFWFLVVGYILIIISPSFLTEGMFLDGLIYSEIAANMAEGKGSFWDPYMNHIFFPHFREHPPLALGINSLFYRIFGDYLIVDKIYSVFTFVVSTLLIVVIWKKTTNSLRLSWFPVLLWTLIPLVTWSATNNMLENTMTIFVLLSVCLSILAIQKNKNILFVLSGVSLFLAFLTKGFTGLFPLIFVIIYDFFFKEHSIGQTVKSFLFVLLGLLIPYFVLDLVSSGFSEYIMRYFNNQVVGSIENVATVSSRFFIVWRLVQEILVALLLLVVVSVIHKSAKSNFFISNKKDDDFKWFLVFLFLGLSGVLPIMISMKQSGFYMLTALPFFGLSFAHLYRKTSESLLQSVTRRTYNWMLGVSLFVLFLGIGLNIAFAGTYARNEVFLEDMKLVLNEIGDDKTISISQKERTLFGWHAYFSRYGDVGLDCRNLHEYLLLSDPKHLYEFDLQDKYVPVDIETKSIFLYKFMGY